MGSVKKELIIEDIKGVDKKKFPEVVKLLESREVLKLLVSKDLKVIIADPPQKYKTKIAKYIKEGWINSAIEVVNKAVAAGVKIKISVDQYKIALNACIKKDRINSAIEVVNEAIVAGVKDAKFYKIALNACIKKGWIDDVIKIVDKAVAAGVKIKISVDQYKIALNACIKEEWTNAIIEIVNKAVAAGVKDDELFATAIEYLAKYNKTDAVSTIVKHLSQ